MPSQPIIVGPIYPRHQVLSAIIDELDRFVPQDFDNFEEASQLIAIAGQTAENLWTDSYKKTLAHIDIMQEERDAFTKFIQMLTVDDLNDVKALPFRRVLTKEESTVIWNALRQRWGIKKEDRYWYPLVDYEIEELLAFNAASFISNPKWGKIPQLFISKGISRVYELPEIGLEREIAIEGEPFYHGVEIFWTTINFDAIIYVSHEDSITFGGWLVEEIKKLIPDWQEQLFTWPEY